MKNKIIKGWNFTRIVYTLIGLVLLIHAVIDYTIFGILLGVYITAMGVFAFDCAAGNCSIDTKENI